MAIQDLEARNVRCIEELYWELDPGVNVLVGKNGAGKTSILEGIVLAGTGKALRPGGSRGVIRRDAGVLNVRLRAGVGVSACEVIYERHAKNRTWVLNHEAIKSPTEIYERIPLLVLNPETHYAMLQDPHVRRGLMSWFLFHVEPLFLDMWRRFQRIMRQRNAGLKMGNQKYRAFDPGYIQVGEALGAMWRRAQEELELPFTEAVHELGLHEAVTTAFRNGWTGDSLEEALEAARPGDEKMGYSQVGPQRADINFLMGGKPISEGASHGQQKVIVSAWRLALARQVRKAGKEPILLIDDLAAELDQERRQAFYETLRASDMQVVVTAIEADALSSSFTMFHVEHGQLTPP